MSAVPGALSPRESVLYEDPEIPLVSPGLTQFSLALDCSIPSSLQDAFQPELPNSGETEEFSCQMAALGAPAMEENARKCLRIHVLLVQQAVIF